MASPDFLALKGGDKAGLPRLVRWLTAPPSPPPLRVAVEGTLSVPRRRWLTGLVTSRRPDLRVRLLDGERFRRIAMRDSLRASGPDPWFPRWCRLVDVCFVADLERSPSSPRQTQAAFAGLGRLARHMPGALVVEVARGGRLGLRMSRVAAGPHRARPTRWRAIGGWNIDPNPKEERRLYRPWLGPEYRASVDRLEEVFARAYGSTGFHLSFYLARAHWRVVARLAELKAEGWRLTDPLVLAVAEETYRRD